MAFQGPFPPKQWCDSMSPAHMAGHDRAHHAVRALLVVTIKMYL